MKKAAGLLVAISIYVASSIAALAQTAPNWTYHYVPTTAEWNAVFAGKQDYLGAPPLLITGGTMTGPLIATPAIAGTTGFNVACGSVAPSSPNNGDIWCNAGLVYAQIGGSTVPLGASSGSVTSVALALPVSVFTVSGSPITGSGTLTATYVNQSANRVFAGPTSGGAATPAFRALVNADFPSGFVVAGTGLTGGSLAGGGTAAIDKATAANVYAGTSNKVLTADNVYAAEVTISFNASQTFDFGTFLNGRVTLTGNITSLTCTGMKAGQGGVISLVQDGTGSRTMVAGWCSQFLWAGGVRGVLSTVAASIDALIYQCISSSVCYVSLGKAQAN